MGNYRKKAVEVNAAKVSDVIPKATGAWSSLPSWIQVQYAQGNLLFGPAYLIINGGDVAGFEDWLLEGADGTLSRCDAAEFESCYEAI
ncbi:hypothetical protein [Streptomyces sp. NPDC048720]|uniref:hypothetical protein n=1 Tax=Streptomyces sp. NPDC048720 TaxID=3365588 RepID=UPI003715DE24